MVRLILYGMMLGVAVMIMGSRNDPGEVLFWALMAAKMVFDIWDTCKVCDDDEQ